MYIYRISKLSLTELKLIFHFKTYLFYFTKHSTISYVSVIIQVKFKRRPICIYARALSPRFRQLYFDNLNS